MTLRSVTIDATPTAMHRKKNSRRLHDARISRTAIRNTKSIFQSPTVSTTRPSLNPKRASAIDSQLGIVGHEHDGGAARCVNLAQKLHDVPAVGRIEVAGRLVGQNDRRDRWRARAQAPRAAAHRPTAATDSDAPARSGRLLRAAIPPGFGRFWTPMISIGTDTFSSAVSDGIR